MTLHFPAGAGSFGNQTRKVVLIYLLLTVVLLTPPVTAVVTGALHVPVRDDWAYLRIAHDFSSSGHIHFIDWNDINFVGLLPFTSVASWVFGDSIAALRAVGLTAYVLLALGTWRLSRLYLSRTRTAFATVVALTYPTAGPLAGTLMTDLPAAACQIWCLALGIGSMRSRTRRHGLVLLAVAFLIGLLGFSIRQQALAAPLALMIGLVCSRQRRRDPVILGMILTVICAAAAFTVWRAGLPLGGTSGQLWPLYPGLGMSAILSVFLLSGAFLLPALWVHASRIGWASLGYGVLALNILFGGLLYLLLVAKSSNPFRGDGVSRVGASGNGSLIAGTRPNYVAPVVWYALVAMMVLGVALICSFAVYYLRRRRAVWGSLRRAGGEAAVVSTFLLISALGVIAAALTAGFTADRYAAPMIVVLVPQLVRPPSGARDHPLGGIPLAAACFLAIVTLGYTWDAQAFAVARWDAGTWAVDNGYPPSRIDAGFEWVGFNYTDRIQENISRPPPDHLPGAYYLDVFPRFRRELVLLEEGPSPEQTTVASFSYPRWFGLSTGHVRLVAVPQG